MLSYLGIIPARYASTRFPGKPLADIRGKTMIQRVYDQARIMLDLVVVATDDERIHEEVVRFGGDALMTSREHRSGTDRCAEALHIYEKKMRSKIDVVINIQGDEPFIQSDQIAALKTCFKDKSTEIATLIKRITDVTVLQDPNRPKVVVDKNGFALYFSRSAIPFVRGIDINKWHKMYSFYQHIGMYAYKSSILKKLSALDIGDLEKAESLEQLRWLENGFKIKTAMTDHESYSIDTPEDLQNLLIKNFPREKQI
jgi:3-deoxy-manno-octulosonate cytidylyltransferase (CMP-KDO synthetase)